MRGFVLSSVLSMCMHGGLNQKERTGLYASIWIGGRSTTLMESNDGKDKAVVIVTIWRDATYTIAIEFNVILHLALVTARCSVRNRV